MNAATRIANDDVFCPQGHERDAHLVEAHEVGLPGTKRLRASASLP
jgi:hypothetical protein